MSRLLRILASFVCLCSVAVADERDVDLFRPARARALVIGAGDYERLGRLRYARADAESFASALVDHLGFEASDVRVLVDGANADPLRTPTLGHIRTELGDLLADPARSATDLFVLYFSGHGVAADDGDFLLPTDVGPNNAREDGLAVRELVTRLVDGGAQNVLLVFDACRDGALRPFGRDVLTLASESRLAVLLSAGPGQASYESASKGAGLFTHYLVRALTSAQAWDPVSGAVWVSRLGAEARARVSAYTAEGFDVVQAPEVHLPPGEDVLLAARLPEALDAEAALDFAGEHVSADGRAYPAAVARYAQALYQSQRFAECAAVLETAEQLGALSPDLGYALVRSLFQLGRTGEGRRALDRLRARHPNAYGTLAATVQDLSGVLPLAERVAAARGLLYGGEPIGELALVTALLALKDGATSEEAAAAAQRYLELAPPESKLVWIGRTLLAAMEGRDGDAVGILEEAERGLGPSYELELARHFLFRYLEDEPDPTRILAHIERWRAEDTVGGRWLARKAAVRAAHGDREGARADARAALRMKLSPEDVTVAVRAAGFGAFALRAELDQQLAERPDAWEVVLARLFVYQSAPEGVEAAFDALEYTSGRRVHMMALLSELELLALEDGVSSGETDQRELVRYRWDLLERAIEGAPRFEDDSVAWRLLVGSAVFLDRALQAGRAVRKHLGATIEAGGFPPELCGSVGLALLATGDLEPLQAVRAVLPARVAARSSMGWFEVALRALRDDGGDREAAHALAATLQPASGQALGVDHAWRALVAAREGRGDDARTHLAGLSGSSNAIAIALAAAAHETLGEHVSAQACYELALSERVMLAPYLRPLCLTRMLRAGTPPPEERANVAFMASREGPGNSLYARLSCLAEPAVAAFVGAHSYTVEGVEGPEGQGGTLRLFVAPDGRVDGFLTRAEGAPRTLEGSVDGWGNLRAKLGGAETPTDVLAMLAPPAVLREHTTWAEHGQLFLLLDESGCSSVWIGR